MNPKTQVFLSFKFHDASGGITPDYYMAKDLYERLSRLGLNVFFSDETLTELARSDYKEAIDTKLDEAQIIQYAVVPALSHFYHFQYSCFI